MMLHSVLSLVLNGAVASSDICCISKEDLVQDCNKVSSDPPKQVCVNDDQEFDLCKDSALETLTSGSSVGDKFQLNGGGRSVDFVTGACGQASNRGSLRTGKNFPFANNKFPFGNDGFPSGNGKKFPFENNGLPDFQFGNNNSPFENNGLPDFQSGNDNFQTGFPSGNGARVDQNELVECTIENAPEVCGNAKCMMKSIGGVRNGGVQNCGPNEVCVQNNNIECTIDTIYGCHCEGKKKSELSDKSNGDVLNDKSNGAVRTLWASFLLSVLAILS